MKVAIIIPAHNEEKRIAKTLEAYLFYFENLRKQKLLDYEILVVINNSKDKTLDIVKSFSKKNIRAKYLNLVKGGKGYAVLEGFKEALRKENDLIGFVDADMATKPEAFYDLIRNLGKNDGAIASRYVKGAIVEPKPTLSRIISSRIFNYLIRAVLIIPYRDTQCGAKIFKREAIKETINFFSLSKWAFDVDIIYTIRKKGFKIVEIPTIWADKEYSKINFLQSGPWMTLGVIRLRLLNSPFNSLMRIYDKMLNRLWKIK